MKIKTISAIGIATILLTACGGGGDSGSSPGASNPTSPQPVVLTTAQKQTILADSQKQDAWGLTVFPALTTYDKTKSWRWNPERDGLIPVKIVGNVAVINSALDEVEAGVGKTLFDRTLYSTTDEYLVIRGIILKSGTPPPVLGQVQNNCGVTQPASPVQPPDFNFNGTLVTPAKLPGSAWLDATQSLNPGTLEILFPNLGTTRQDGLKSRSTLEVLVDTSNPNCTDIKGYYVHELSHALGLGAHFDGFGTGTNTPEKYLSVLKLLYSNPPGTEYTKLQ